MKNHHSSHSNKIASRLLKTVLLAGTAISFLTACGQRGSLYIPTAPEAAQRSSIVETLNRPASSETDKNSTSSTRAPMTPPGGK
jgi:predicted small lipoprotein YifL